MQTLRNLRRIIKEQLETAEYKALVEIHYDREFKVTEILDQVRALCGIVIVNSESTEKMTDRKEKVLTKIKFYALGTSTNEFIAKMVDKALSIDGIYAFRIKKVKTNKKS
jgi:hypothetical protein|tara:strand:- start:886 stop:1215 length:330 start_codon:yes stop_codon:yes gene_type:complete